MNLAQILKLSHTPCNLVSLQLYSSVQYFYSHFPGIDTENQKDEKTCLSYEDKAQNKVLFNFIILNWVKSICLYKGKDKLKLCSDRVF